MSLQLGEGDVGRLEGMVEHATRREVGSGGIRAGGGSSRRTAAPFSQCLVSVPRLPGREG